jgi:hypothetical protein
MTFVQYCEAVLKPQLENPDWNMPVKYARNLKRWTALFRREQLLVLSHDEIRDDPEKVAWRIRGFLGGEFPPRMDREVQDQTKAVASEGDTQALGPIFHEMNRELYDFLEAHPGPKTE